MADGNTMIKKEAEGGKTENMMGTPRKKKIEIGVTSAFLHVIAMLFMLSDHMWATVTPGHPWMTCVGRIAYPIFAFMIVEGYFHTHSLMKYMGRMLVFALITEIPFDLMYGNAVIYPFHQNVMWTFLISLCGIWIMETVKAKTKEMAKKRAEQNGEAKLKKYLWIIIPVDIVVVLSGFIIGLLSMVDYYGMGVVTVFLFYFFRGRKWWCYLGQVLVMYYLNVEVLGGLCYIVTIFGHKFEVVQQGFALLALIPIWLYRGKQGYHSKWFQYLCYAFYPGHIIVLVLIQKLF